jgi:tetratricopeptide (TPR) repeat protein
MSDLMRTALGVPSVAPRSFKKALAAYNRGDLAKAESHCAATLNAKPDFFDALHLLAIVQSRTGRPSTALAIFEKALKLRPDNPELLNNRASALSEVNRYEEALAGYDRALDLRPNYADAYNNRGCVLMEIQRYEDALESYSKALVLEPDNAEFANNLGRALTRLKRYADALDCYDDALALRPNYVDALINRGVTLVELKQFDAALACFDKALAHAPHHREALLNRCRVLAELSRFEEALVTYDHVLQFYSDRPELYIDRGLVLTNLKRFKQAFESYDEALKLNCDAAPVSVHRAMTLKAMGEDSKAIEVIDQLIAARPNYPEGHNARGVFSMQLGRLPEAIKSLRQAVKLRANYPEAAWNLGYLLLLHGNFIEGWRYYESRRIQKGTTWTKLKGPEWQGEPLQGKRLLLYAEQGFGDALQFVRFVRTAARMGAQVMLGVYGPLAVLFRMMDEKPLIVRHGEVAPDCDYHAPIMSVPFILGLDEKQIPANVPYLRADEARVASWKARLPKATFQVGIAWQGSTTDPERWLPLKAFAPLNRVPGVTLISLQKTDGLDQMAELPAGIKVETLGPDFDAGPDAFLDTAAVMMNLDLVVSIDTGIAHLAGALGRPVWIALKYHPDWRWMLERSDSPWYPTARLFRQRQNGEWTPVMEEIAAELAALVSRKSRESARSQSPSGLVLAPVSIGELIDKIVILEIKAARMTDPYKLIEVSKELDLLRQIDYGAIEYEHEIKTLKEQLRHVNETLWDIEDRLREREHGRDFGPDFIELARAVYKTNDRRAALKRRMNEISGSALKEIKTHPTY